MRSLFSNDRGECFPMSQFILRVLRWYTNEDKIVPNTDNLWYLKFYIFTILYWLQILSYWITTRKYRCILSLWDSFYELQCLASSSSAIYLWPDDGLVTEAETCRHLVTLNKINTLNTSCVLTCESLLIICWLLSLLWYRYLFPAMCDSATSIVPFIF
jgi:hypothetical protein